MTLPPALAAVMVAFRPLFRQRVYDRALVLTAGALLATGARTVTAALRITGHDDRPFAPYHRVLSHARWSARLAARTLLRLLVDRFVPTGAPVLLALDDTIERRWGPRIAARGIYRDPVRSSHGHFTKASGLRWLCLALLAPIPWAARVWALPFLTLLCPSERYYERRAPRRRPKTLADHARQAVLQAARWLPGRRLVVVADAAFAALRLLDAVRGHAAVVTRLRLDAALYDPPPERVPGQRGRGRVKGARQPSLRARAADPATAWARVVIGGRVAELATGTAVWYHEGRPAVPLRWVLVREPGTGEPDAAEGAERLQAFLCTDAAASAAEVVGWYAARWSLEVTFAEARRHLGVETQRQWSALAIGRTTPCLLGLYAVVTLAADTLWRSGALSARQSRWYKKGSPTFSDALAGVRGAVWASVLFRTSGLETETAEELRGALRRVSAALAYAA